jgi:hypothetical protein
VLSDGRGRVRSSSTTSPDPDPQTAHLDVSRVRFQFIGRIRIGGPEPIAGDHALDDRDNIKCLV